MKSLPPFTSWFIAPTLLLASCDTKQTGGKADADGQAAEASPDSATTSGKPTDLSAPNAPTEYTKPYQDILAKVNAQCPDQYPELVTPLPDEHELATMDIDQLMGMLDSWNPVLRMEAAKELGNRGTEVIAELRQGTRSAKDKIRAGSATALAAVCSKLRSEELPEGLTEDFIRLTTDEEHEVRVAALNALSALAPKTREAQLAILAMCTDPDEYLAQDAMVTLNKSFELHKLPIEDIEAGIKAAMTGPLPNGKGHIVKIITKLKPEDQRRFIPTLVEHVKWIPRRDTMFAAGGQEEAIEMLTRMGVTEVVPHLPGISDKVVRGPGLYLPVLTSLQAYGKDAKPALPELKRMLADLESKGRDSEFAPPRELEAYIKELKKTIELIESH
ncbi:MAG: HEAT repeat domain-containing protein [Akkermansiaceae bacterium]|nr:HEAT repeat domain-containing protein [Akkermansiaceae bacterium]